MPRRIAPGLVRATIGLAVAIAMSGLSPMTGQQIVRAAEYTMVTEARYAVDPDAGAVEVSVDVSFENTTPDPPGQFSAFEVIDLALQPGATAVTARDTDGPLEVSVGDRATFVAVSIRTRAAVRYEQIVTFTLEYAITDGAADSVRIRPSVVLFSAWGFGTSGTVSISLPDALEVRVDGSPMTARHDAGSVILDSGLIDDPSAWLARVTGTAPASYVTESRAVPLAGGTVDLQVRAWADDRAWGERIADLLAAALPRLEAALGVDYPRVGPLVVVETTPDPAGTISEPQAGAAEIDVAFTEPDFTVLHQASHVWLRPELVADAWIREGFASWAAEQVAPAVDVARPYDPAARAAELAGAAFPLESWGAGASTSDQDAWAYAASWELADRLARVVGADPVRAVWQRVADGVSAYDPAGSRPAGISGTITPLDSRRLLDQLEAVSGASVEAIFTENVFSAAQEHQLAARSAAREAYAGLLAAAGDWGAPEPIRAAMADWRFDDATAGISEARAWLADRDDLYATLDELGLTAPARLQDRYRTAGGGEEARVELDAEAAVASGFAAGRDRAAVDRDLLERIGLLGTPAPGATLDRAAGLFAQGDLRGAADAIDEMIGTLDQARVNGAVRLGAVVAVLVLLAIGLILAARRRRAKGYTAAP